MATIDAESKIMQNKTEIWYKALTGQKPATLWQRLAAAGLSREVQLMMSGKSFAIISAQNGKWNETQNGTAINNVRDKSLRDELQRLGLGFIRNKGIFTDLDLKVAFPENSLFIMNIDEQTTLMLAQKYEQQAYLWGTGGEWWVKQTDGSILTGGNVKDSFHQLDTDEVAENATITKGRRWTFNPPNPPSDQFAPKAAAYYIENEVCLKYANANGLRLASKDFNPPASQFNVWLPLYEA